jgi:hypothetical protein
LSLFFEEVQSESEHGLTLTDFSFSESKKKLQNFKGSFTDAVVNERREEL